MRMDNMNGPRTFSSGLIDGEASGSMMKVKPLKKADISPCRHLKFVTLFHHSISTRLDHTSGWCCPHAGSHSEKAAPKAPKRYSKKIHPATRKSERSYGKILKNNFHNVVGLAKIASCKLSWAACNRWKDCSDESDLLQPFRSCVHLVLFDRSGRFWPRSFTVLCPRLLHGNHLPCLP